MTRRNNTRGIKVRRTILDYIRYYWIEHGYSPSMVEIMRGCNISSKSIVNYHLQILKADGAIKMDAGIARSIRLVGMTVVFS